ELERDRRCPARHGRDPARPPFRQFLLRGRVAKALCCTPWFAARRVPRQTDGDVPLGRGRVGLDGSTLLDAAGGDRCRGHDQGTGSYDRLPLRRGGVPATPSTAEEEGNDRHECP